MNKSTRLYDVDRENNYDSLFSQKVRSTLIPFVDTKCLLVSNP